MTPLLQVIIKVQALGLILDNQAVLNLGNGTNGNDKKGNNKWTTEY